MIRSMWAYRFNNVGSFEETVFSTIPESQMTASMRYQEIIV